LLYFGLKWFLTLVGFHFQIPDLLSLPSEKCQCKDCPLPQDHYYKHIYVQKGELRTKMIPTIYIDGVANGSTQNINTMDATIRFQFWSRLRGWTDEFGVRSPPFWVHFHLKADRLIDSPKTSECRGSENQKIREYLWNWNYHLSRVWRQHKG